MLEFLTENLSTILIGAVILTVVALIIVKLARDRRKGKNSCGCGCENCPSACVCHKK